MKNNNKKRDFYQIFEKKKQIERLVDYHYTVEKFMSLFGVYYLFDKNTRSYHISIIIREVGYN